MPVLNDQVSLTTKGKIAIITLNQPKKLNALSQDLYYRLSCLLREVAARNEIYITILTGTGRYFSAYVPPASAPSKTAVNPLGLPVEHHHFTAPFPSSSLIRSPRITPSVNPMALPLAYIFPSFASGAEVTMSRFTAAGAGVRREFLRNFVANNLEITNAFYTHPKILITALNGPAIGLSAALISFSDFIYATPHAFLLTPFTSLGLVAEGGASHAFVQRLGISKANEALIMSKRITSEELLATGFVNKVFETGKDQQEQFLGMVLKEVDERLGAHLSSESLVRVKALIRKPERERLDAMAVQEVFGGLERFVDGVPQEEFRKVASGEKKHKL